MMTERAEHCIRLRDWSVNYTDIVSPRRPNVLRSLKERIDGIFAFLGNCFHFEILKGKPTSKILHPQGPFLQTWNKIFMLSCVFAVFVDPLFLYIPVINDQNSCWYLDRKLEITANVLRSITDIFYVVHIVLQFWTGFITSSATTFRRGVLVQDRYAIAKRYFSTYFLIDIWAVLPLPQVVILLVLPNFEGSELMEAKDILMFIVICQYVPRLIRIRPLYLQITRSSGIITETTSAGAALSLIIYMLASHTYFESDSLRMKETREKMHDIDQWMSYRLLPENLKERIRRYEQYRWQETSGVDEERLLMNLPKDLRREIKRHICLSLLMRVPMFADLDDQLLNVLCDRLKPVLYTEGGCIVREGDPVNEMFFIMRGDVMSMTTNGGKTGFFNSDVLKAGDFCGEELLTWALDPSPTSSLPSSVRTVKPVSEVEAFALMAEDLKFVATQFRRLHSKQLRHTFKFYSQQWKTWAACFIQVAWRRHCRKKIEDSLREELLLQPAIVNDGYTLLSSGAETNASRIARRTMRTLKERVRAMLLQKPAEPNFSAEEQQFY